MGYRGFRKFRFTLIAVLLFFALAELGARVGIRMYWNMTDQALMPDADEDSLVYDPNLGWVWPEGGLFRGKAAVPVEKSKDVFRVITLGDSCTWGAGVNPNETYSAKLEKFINEKNPPLRVEVLNAGVNGYLTGQMADLLETKLLQYDPDAVVVYANPFDRSDARMNVKPPLVPSRASRITQGLLYHSKLYYLIKLAILKGHTPGEKLEHSSSQVSPNLTRLANLADSAGARLFIVEYVIRRGEEGEKTSLWVSPLNYSRKWEGVFVPVLDAMIASAIAPDDLLQDAVHPRPVGHSIIAVQLADAIQSLRLIDAEAKQRKGKVGSEKEYE